ncbi:winged helix-turn-helix domain-containing protein [Yinghuangia sp. ASG 101]|uniref:AfsR/SARP family transcriptional regulator n=1 Tax=Yinghuangia sp. ASG 101 TaxID=2896848 RepID=UPI001E36A97D|nr:winged helix-turn-helix domain-containing protein [Yinghuangia sp. ASG 101]UGQ12874.1 winged helix-turn-helix domain-containing protein [Yinghuangia sp. ASG 101]
MLDAVRDGRPVLLAAPAGHGKTTLLDQYAATWQGPSAGLRFTADDRYGPGEVRAAVLARVRAPGTLLVLDDLHLLPDAAHTFELLAATLPADAHLLAAARPLPALNLSRAELAHTVVVGPDDLRLRWWEVDRLFTDVHGRPADPVLAWDATWLTGGWAAPLHEFLLCTRGLSRRQVRRTLTAPGVPFAVGYLDRQVLDELGPDLREFLMRVAIHPELTPAVCASADTPAARAEAAAMLRRAERAGALVRNGAGLVGEPLLRHLLVHRFATTSPDAPGVFTAAAARLRAAGDPLGAAWAAFLARDRPALHELMERHPVVIGAALPAHWHGILRAFAGPTPPVDLGEVRRIAEEFGIVVGGPETGVPTAVVAGPGGTEFPEFPGVPLDDEGRLAEALSRMGAGDYRAAIAGFDAFLGDRDGPLAAAAELFRALSCLLSGHGCDVRDVEKAAQRVAHTGPAWLGRLARAGLTLTGASEYRGEARAVRAACERLGDVWGGVLAGHMEACAAMLRGEPDPDLLTGSGRRLAAAGMAAAATWSLAYQALARAQRAEPGAEEIALRAERDAERWELPGALVIARCARLLADPGASDVDHDTLAEDAARLGIRLETFLRVRRDPAAPPPTAFDIRCFGGFAVRLAGKPLDLARLAPQSRVLFRVLALHAGRPVHREVLAAALWPDAPAHAAFHRLQTAVYKLRRFLEPGRGRRGTSAFVPFEDGAYRLRLPEGSYLDIAAAEDALARARRAAARGDAAREARTLRELLAVADALLLPETGPEEWVIEARERWADAAAEARARLAGRASYADRV